MLRRMDISLSPVSHKLEITKTKFVQSFDEENSHSTQFKFDVNVDGKTTCVLDFTLDTSLKMLHRWLS